MRFPVLPVIVAAFSVLCMTAAYPGPAFAEEGDLEQIRGVVDTMNRAVTERDLPRLLSTFAEGSVTIDLFPAHRYGAATGEDAVKTAALQERWQAVAPILFATTKVYHRTVRAMDVHIDGGMAVAWLDVETETLPAAEGATSKTNRFREICILRRYDAGWRIVTMTNNRHD